MSLLFCGRLLRWPRKMTGLSHLIFASDKHPTWLTCFCLLAGMQALRGGGWPAHRGRPAPPSYVSGCLCVWPQGTVQQARRSLGGTDPMELIPHVQASPARDIFSLEN